MKVITILGTRPEIIRLSRIIEKLDRLCDHTLVHTGQNYDPYLSDVFFDQLGIRKPDYYMGVSGSSFGMQIGQIIEETEKVLVKEKPDRLLLLGDTNSALAAIVSKRMGISVYHLEAGNRCYDDRVPEEVNRRIIDHSSDVLMPYTERSRMNLLREGIPGERIFVTGNPINEVIRYYESKIFESSVLQELGLVKKNYFLVTMHRAENVDVQERIKSISAALEKLQQEYDLPIIISTHPHTRNRMQSFGIKSDNPMIRWLQPFGFFDFITLERNARCVISDSGTVQEECAIFGVSNITIRDVTERPETIECGSNMLSGAHEDMILSCIKTVLEQRGVWKPPHEYLEDDVSSKVVRVVLGFQLHTSKKYTA
jgi:UDP-N-acetylglucosamine 2-epimerase (non-hydrolysing)